MLKTKASLVFKNCFEKETFETDDIGSLKKLNSDGKYSTEVYFQEDGRSYFKMNCVEKSLLVNMLERTITSDFHGKKTAYIERVR